MYYYSELGICGTQGKQVVEEVPRFLGVLLKEGCVPHSVCKSRNRSAIFAKSRQKISVDPWMRTQKGVGKKLLRSGAEEHTFQRVYFTEM